ncbi:glycosyltransferase [Blastococcus sp. SYSU DS0510]
MTGTEGRAAGGLRVLRLCSVFEPLPDPGRGPDAELDGRTARFDPIGGMQNHTAALTRCLDAQGVAQTVLTSRLAGPRGTSRLGDGARVVRVGLPVRFLRQCWAVAALPAALRRRVGVDVVHVHQGEDLAVLPLARLAARRHGCPLVVTVHCSVRHTMRGRGLRARLLHRLGGAVERAALRRADAVVVLTARARGGLLADGVAEDRVHVIPSGFDPALFRPPADRPGSRPTGGLRIGYVGRLAPQKRPDLVVRAFGRMAEPAQLVVVGDGPERPRVESLVARSPARDRIRLSGFVPHDAVPGVLEGLDVLVLPSAYEEMGSVLVEAMAAGLPVVASDVGGIPEVVRDGETGLLVPPGDVAALAAALDRLVADDRLRGRLARAARWRAAAYAWPELSSRVAGVYAAVLGRVTVSSARA